MPHHNVGHIIGFYWFFWLIIVLIAAVLFAFLNKYNVDRQSDYESPMDIARNRFARGEISKNEYEALINDLKNLNKGNEL